MNDIIIIKKEQFNKMLKRQMSHYNGPSCTYNELRRMCTCFFSSFLSILIENFGILAFVVGRARALDTNHSNETNVRRRLRRTNERKQFREIRVCKKVLVFLSNEWLNVPKPTYIYTHPNAISAVVYASDICSCK